MALGHRAGAMAVAALAAVAGCGLPAPMARSMVEAGGGRGALPPTVGSPQDISVAPSGDVWVVDSGDYDVRDGTGNGRLLHYFAQRWSVVATLHAALRSVWAAGADDVWVAGDTSS